MEANLREEIIKGSTAALLDKRVESKLQFRPRLVSNRREKGELVLTEVEKNLRSCTEFSFSVAFITLSGLEMLLQTFKEIKDKAKGRIITTDYLAFSEPKALQKLLEFPFIETRVAVNQAFHTKGYCFKEESGEYTIMIGSANLTGAALKTNKEWNLKTTSLEDGMLTEEFRDEFTELWDISTPLTESWIAEYTERYEENKRATAKEISLIPFILEPNYMQSAAIKALRELRAKGKKKGLLIAATGTGKTYLSAFDAKEYNPKHMLFLVHREQIVQKAKEDYLDVFGKEAEDELGIISGGSRELDKRIIFATIQTMSKASVYKSFSPDYFDYIVIDEVHKAGAESYQRILNYFRPDFLLGMSATPDRPDAGRRDNSGIERNIYKLFDYNIAYEIRLNQAMEANLLCPFHYFGIVDISVDGQPLSDNADFRYLTCEERVDNIIKNAEYYGYSGHRVKGLIFCSKKEEAKQLSVELNKRGYRTVALTGEDDIERRIECVDRLEMESGDGCLDYIITVDIFNEGIDIPSVNQVIMLRPTESAIIFVQQLGRGLRKDPGKEFVVVIDFIANYQKNYFIPIALSGDNSYKKDNLRRYVSEGSRMIAGTSTINFDQIAKERIYKTIDNAKFNETALLKTEYNALKYKLGHIPSLFDFDTWGAIDVFRLIEKEGSYYAFLKKHDPDYHIRLNEAEEKIITFLSTKMAYGKRASDLYLLKQAVNNPYRDDLMQVCEKELPYGISEEEKKSTVSYLTNEFPKNADKNKFSSCIFIAERGNDYTADPVFRALLEANDDFKKMVVELIDFGIFHFNRSYSRRYKNTDLVLYEKYTYEDVCRLLGWKQNFPAQNIGGYFYDETTKTLPVFVNYVKTDTEEVINYEDEFLDEENFIAFSKKNRAVDSKDAQHIYKIGEENKENRLYLFVRKNKDDQIGKEFYFLGEVEAVGEPEATIIEGTKGFKIHYRLETPVRNDIFDYITSDIEGE